MTCENWKLQARAAKLWSQTEATYKQVNNLSTELTCFKELQKQEQLAASYRVNNLLDEVNKQKTLESQLQHRYGDLLAESERLQNFVEDHKRKVAVESTEVGPTEAAEEMKVDNENDASQVAAVSEEEMKVENEDVAGVKNDASQVAADSEEGMKIDNADVAEVENDASQVAVGSEGIPEDTVTGGDDKLAAEPIAPEKDIEATEKTMDGDANIVPDQDTV